MATVRAIRIQRPSWANLRTALGLLLFCVALLAGQQLISGAKETTEVWVATRDLPADTLLGAGDVRVEEVSLSDALEGHYLESGAEVEGRTLSRPMLAGEMVAGSWVLEATADSGRSMTISLDGSSQLAAGIGLGDRIDIIATFDAGNARSKTVPVVRSAEVVELVTSKGLVEGSDVVGVTVSVPDELVGMVAFARHNAAIDIVQVHGGATSEDGWSVTRDDF